MGVAPVRESGIHQRKALPSRLPKALGGVLEQKEQMLPLGTELRLCHFGVAHIRKIFVPKGTKEVVYEVKTVSGEILDLSPAYVKRWILPGR